jgi:hypothetical protein
MSTASFAAFRLPVLNVTDIKRFRRGKFIGETFVVAPDERDRRGCTMNLIGRDF